MSSYQICWSSNLLSNLNSWYFLTPSQSLIHLHKFQIFEETKYKLQLPFFLGNNTERKSIYETLLEFSEIILCDSIILNILRHNTNSLNIFKKLLKIPKSLWTLILKKNFLSKTKHWNFSDVSLFSYFRETVLHKIVFTYTTYFAWI